MRRFLPETLFLIQNWDTVQEMLSAIEGLKMELSELLLSVRPALEDLEWWSPGWEFVEYKPGQVYIWNAQWPALDGSVVWIGVEMFTPESVFGNTTPPRLYVWVTGGQSQRERARSLARRITEAGEPVVGQVTANASSGYVVRHPVTKCLPEGAEGYPDAVREQVVAFIDHYARLLSDLMAQSG